MSDCVLINSPDASYSEHYVADSKMPLGLLYIAAYLRSRQVRVRIIDCHAEHYTLATLVQTLIRNPPSLVGLNITTPNRKTVYEIAAAIKKTRPTLTVIAGGPHATCAPADVFKGAPSIDGVVMGEGEEVVYRVLQTLPKTPSFRGFCSNPRDLVAAALADRIVDLDTLPFPAYDFLDVRRYISVQPELFISTSRGCRYDCVFCCSRALLGKRVIFRRASKVFEEMQMLRSRYGITRFYFYDDNILMWPELDSFCDRIRNTGIRWTAQAAINDLRVDKIPRLAEGGCIRLSFGFESGSRSIQKYVGKLITTTASSKISALAQQGIACRGFFTIGFPQETIAEIAETARYVLDLRGAGLDDIAIFPARPFPGTRLFQDSIELHGDEAVSALLDFQYVNDYQLEEDARVAARLRRYNTIPTFRLNARFDSSEIRRMIKTLYTMFFKRSQFSLMSTVALGRYLLAAA